LSLNNIDETDKKFESNSNRQDSFKSKIFPQSCKNKPKNNDLHLEHCSDTIKNKPLDDK
jgi:hypothetical protein